MPKIPEYSAPLEALTESTRGAQAFEQAGRRLGPLYNEAALFQREQGKAAAQGYKQQLWPFDIIKLREATPTGVNIKVDAASLLGGGAPSHAALGQISRGAGALGNALRDGGNALANSSYPSEETIGDDAESITVSIGGGKQDQKNLDAYNQFLDKRGSQYAQELMKTQDWWTRYNGGNPASTDQSKTSSTGPNPAPAPAPGAWDTLKGWFNGGTAPVTDTTTYTGE